MLSGLRRLLPDGVRGMNCPKCGEPLKRIEQPKTGPMSMLNSDQWMSQRAGDWFCTCHNNNRGNKPYAYFWDAEIVARHAPEWQKLVDEVIAKRTAWLTQHGVQISQEFAEFAEAIGNLTDAVARHAGAGERKPNYAQRGDPTILCTNCGHVREHHDIEPPYPCFDCEHCEGFSYVPARGAGEAAGTTPTKDDLDLAAALHINYCEDLAADGTPWEVAAEPEPSYFETLKEAIVFLVELGDPEAALPQREEATPEPPDTTGRPESTGFEVLVKIHTKEADRIFTSPEFVRFKIGKALDVRGLEEEIDYTLEVRRVYR